MASKHTTKAAELGRRDGLTEAREALEAGHYVADAKGFDDGLVNAIGGRATAELFGVEQDSDEFAGCLEAYEAAARKSWSEAAE